MYLLLLFKSKSETPIYHHIAVVLALGKQHKTLLSNFFTKQYANLKISLYVRVHIKIIPRKFCILNPRNSRVTYP